MWPPRCRYRAYFLHRAIYPTTPPHRTNLLAFNVVGKCYVEPCVEDGLGMMNKVNVGQSFLVLFSGLIFILQAVYGLWFLQVSWVKF